MHKQFRRGCGQPGGARILVGLSLVYLSSRPTVYVMVHDKARMESSQHVQLLLEV